MVLLPRWERDSIEALSLPCFVPGPCFLDFHRFRGC
jgi:hypothetical protein